MKTHASRIENARRYGSGTISDAMESLGLPRTALAGWSYLAKDPGRALVGPAFTLRQAPKARAVSFDRNLARHPEAAKGAPPGSVIVIDVGGRTDIGSWGVNLSLIAQARGVAGLVIHGATRDAEGIRGLDFPVLCRGTTLLSSKWEMETVAMNEPVTIGHVVIRPGDMVCADGDGLIILPAEACESIFDRSEEIERAEEKRRAAIRAGVLE